MSKAPSKQSTDRINILNIWLMLISGLLAFVWPFYLFLFSYAILGPLHYLTEISWLHDRGYYTKRKYDYVFLVAITLLYGSSLFIKFDQTQIVANAVLIAFIGSLALTLTTEHRCESGAAGYRGMYRRVFRSDLLYEHYHRRVDPHNRPCFCFHRIFYRVRRDEIPKPDGVSLPYRFCGCCGTAIAYSEPSRWRRSRFLCDRTVWQRFADPNIWLIRTFGLSSMGQFASDPSNFRQA